MTAQFSETLIYAGEKLAMLTNPLDRYFYLGGENPKFECNCTALWRGYIGTWEIIDDRLYLIKLHGTLENGEKATVATIFPDFPNRVFAHWFTGIIRLPQGKQIQYVHMGYGSVYEKDLLLAVEKGIIQNKTIKHNGTSSDESTPDADIALQL